MQPGDRIADRFVIERLAGSGGMAWVYRATDERTGGPVALKILREREEGAPARFGRECALLAQLNHPNLVRYVAHGTAGVDELYLAMEWLEGEPLFARLQRGQLSVAETLALAHPIIKGLVYAHHRRVVHRDVKPSNIFLVDGELDKAKLVDFGVARHVGYDTQVTGTGIAVGTLAYMAPEQTGRETKPDSRADLYSFGAVLYECLTSRRVLSADHPAALLAKLLLDDPTRLGQLRPDVPKPLEKLIMSLLAKAPEARPGTATEVQEALRRIERDTGEQPMPEAVEWDPTADETLPVVSVVLATEPARAADPRAPAHALDSDTVKATVAAHGGRLDLLADGSALVTFGEGSGADQAWHAARCALALSEHLPEVRVGLSTGEMDEDSDPVGDLIDRAAAAMERAATGQARMDEGTARAVGSSFEVDSTGTSLPILIAERPLGEPSRTVLGRKTPFVGRERELANLEAEFEQCRDTGHARAVLVLGPAGYGKSRLRFELLRRIARRREPVLVLSGRCDSSHAGAPYLPLADVVWRAAGIREGDGVEVAWNKLLARLLPVLGDGAADAVPFIAEVSRIPVPEDAAGHLPGLRHNPLALSDAVGAALERWLRAECANRTVLLFIEDLQWADQPTAAVLDGLMRNLADEPLLIIATGQPEVTERFPHLWHDRSASRVRLPKLTGPTADALVREMLGDDVDPDVAREIVERADGNAFFLEELIRAAARGDRKRLPESVLAVVRARIDALDDDARGVLQAASVFGRTFSSAGVAAVTGEDPSDVDRLLDVLSDAEIASLRSVPGTDDREGAFRHVLAYEAAYGTLSPSERRSKHRHAAAWLERKSGAQPLALAMHHLEGGAPRRAAEFFLAAARQAFESFDCEGAVAHSIRGLEADPRGPHVGELHLMAALGDRHRGKPGEARRQAEAAIRSLPDGSGPWYRAIGCLSVAHATLGNSQQVVDWVQRAQRTPPGDEEAYGERAVTLGLCAWHLVKAGRNAEADALLHDIREAIDLEQPTRSSVTGHAALAFRAWAAGDAGTCIDETELAARAADLIGEIRNASMQRGNLGLYYAKVGELGRAEVFLRQALETAEARDLRYVRAYALHNLGFVLLRLGRLDEAEAMEKRAASVAAHMGDDSLVGASATVLADLALARGDAEAAVKEARRAVARTESARPLQCEALTMLARALGRSGAVDAALGHARAAVELLDAHGSEGGEALARLTLAELLHANGDRGGALEAISDARRRLEDRAALISDPAMRAGFLERVEENRRTLELATAWLGG